MKEAVVLSARDHARFRRDLTLVFWGLLYAGAAGVALTLFLPGTDAPWIRSLTSIAATFCMVAGLLSMARLPIGTGYKGFLVASAALAVLVGIGRFLEDQFGMPRAAALLIEVPTSVSALLLVLALKRLAEQTSWTGVRTALRRDHFLIGAFWLGTDLFSLAMALLPVEVGFRELLGLLFLGLVRLVVFCHLWMTLAEIRRTSRLRQRLAMRSAGAARRVARPEAAR